MLHTSVEQQQHNEDRLALLVFLSLQKFENCQSLSQIPP